MNLNSDAVERLRRDLPIIRNVVGWSAEHLAELLGVSRVTIVNLENTENKMSKIQYLAIRALLQDEIESNDNVTLKNLLTVMIDRENVSEKLTQKLRDQVEHAAKSVGRKAGSAAVARRVGPVVERAINEMKLGEIPEEIVLLGKTKVDEIRARPFHNK